MNAYYMSFSNYDIYTNMAIDEYCYKYIDEPVLRFYTFEDVSITIGFNQRYERSGNMDYIENNNIPLTRRITGGRSVLHYNDLTYSISSKYSMFDNKTNFADRYKKISEIFVMGFNSMNIPAEFSKDKTKNSYTANCFDSVSLYEITLYEQKIIGSAQTFSDDAFLQQGTILVNDQGKYINDIFGKTYTKNLEKLMQIRYNIEDLAKHLYSAFLNNMGYTWQELKINLQDRRLIELIEKYKSRDWIIRR